MSSPTPPSEPAQDDRTTEDQKPNPKPQTTEVAAASGLVGPLPQAQDSDSLSTMSWLSCEQAALAEKAEVQETLKVDPNRGLDTHEAERRRTLLGLNQVTQKPPDPVWKKYLDQFNNPFILLLLASAVISIIMQQIDDAISISLAIIIVVTVGFVQEYRSEKTLERMGALLPPTCTCLRNGMLETLYAKYLVPGDVITLSIGDRIPADVRLFQINELAVDESSFTGETSAKFKTADVMDRKLQMGVSDMGNIGFQGTLVIGGKGTGVVVCTGDRSQFGEVFKMMQSEDPPRTPLQKSMDTLGKQLSFYSLGVIGVIMTIGCLQGRPVLEMFNVGVSLAVAAIPEGLPIVVTVTLAFGVMRMAKKNAVVKRLPTVEALGCVDWICSDKTGTLTSNEMTVCNVVTPEEIFSIEGFECNSDAVGTNPDTLRALEVGLVCNNVVDKPGGGCEGSPTEVALQKAADQAGILYRKYEYQRTKEVPFNNIRKEMSVTCKRKNGSGEPEVFVKGAFECMHASNRFQSITISGVQKRFTEEHAERILQAQIVMGRRGKRVIAVGRGSGEQEIEFVGLIALHDPPRIGVRESIQTLANSKVTVCMITGDSKETAVAISSMVGIQRAGQIPVSGEDIDKMSDADLGEVVDKCFCFYRTSPRQKLRIVKALQANGHIVGMTGDGVNDGVAIKKADVGISMGITGTDVCKEAADMILLDDDFSTILSAIEEGKCIFYNIRNFVRFQLSTSIAALMLISLSTLLDIPNPLNPMQILWINVIMDGPPAQSLGLEPVDHEVLKRPPRKQKEQILSKSLMMNVLLSAAIIIAGTLWVFKETMEDGQMTARDTTMTFTCFVFFDMFNALSSRSQERLIYEIGFFSNKMFVVAVTLSILGQLAVIYLPPLQFIFQTESLALEDLLLLFALSSSVFVICETKKLFERFRAKDFNSKRRGGGSSNKTNEV